MYEYYSETGNYGLILSRETFTDAKAFLRQLSEEGSEIEFYTPVDKLRYTIQGNTVCIYRQ